MKKVIILLVCMICFLSFPAMAEAKSVQVSIPSYKVTLNGQVMENLNNKYPLIVYKDITYFPMAYEYARYLGVKANWYENKQVLFIGITDKPSKQLKKYVTKTKNKGRYTASLPTYKVAVNTIYPWKFLDNSKEQYPVLNFRDVTYLPLTWHLAVDELGWEYYWDGINGLKINSSEPTRPVIDDSNIANTSPSRAVNKLDYYYGKGIYIGYPLNTFGKNFNLVIKKKGSSEMKFNLENQLSDGDYYFDEMVDTNGISDTSDIKPNLTDNVFSVVCVKQHGGKKENLILKINIDSGQIIARETLVAKAVK